MKPQILRLVYVLMISNDDVFASGGGIPHDLVDKVTQYNFTTAEESTDKLMQHSGIFGNMMEAVNR